MLTTERLKDWAEVSPLDWTAVAGPGESQVMAKELLSLRTMPAMVEVDAMMAQIEAFPHVNSYEGAKKLAAIARRAIASAETERKRASEIRKCCPCNCHSQPSSEEAMGLKEHEHCGICIKSLLDEAESMMDMAITDVVERDAEIERLTTCLRKANSQTEEYERKYYLELNKTEDLTRERDELLRLLKWIHGLDLIMDDGTNPFTEFADSRFSDSTAYTEDHRNAKRFLEIVNGGSDDP